MATRASFVLALLALQAACGDRTSISSGKDASAKDVAADAVAVADASLPSPEVLVPGPDLPVLSDVPRADDARADGVMLPDAVTEPDGARDAQPDLPDVSGDGALAIFCSGEAPRLVVNGTESSPTVTGRMIPYDCCDGAEFDVTSPSFSLPIVFSWRRMASAAFTYPASVDLASLPAGWSIQLYAGCNPIMSSCSPPGESFSSGIEGTLMVDRAAASQMDMSLCLHAQETTGSPHTIVHSMDLYAPRVRTTY